MQTTQNQSTILQHIRKEDLFSIRKEQLKLLPEIFTITIKPEAKIEKEEVQGKIYDFDKWSDGLPAEIENKEGKKIDTSFGERLLGSFKEAKASQMGKIKLTNARTLLNSL